jgi:RNA polymerase sigma-54 factor
LPRCASTRCTPTSCRPRARTAASTLSGQLQEARWLIKNVQQRFDTILRVTQAIVDRQKNFFEHGEVAMRPLVLREIAEAVGLHESTISRVTTQKYMLTPRGIFELKYFFGSHVSTDTGGACSATAIRALIKQLVAAEDGKKPLSDHRISDILAPARHPGGAPDRCQVPRGAAHPARQPAQVDLVPPQSNAKRSSR